MPDYLEGEIILIDKPLNWTSFDVVKKIRYVLRKKTGAKKIKVGHAGTLDPLATGLLILCTGKKTKTIEEIQNQEKEYTGTIRLGATTPSSDLETQINREFDISDLTEEKIKETAADFIGRMDQFPPAFSAKKINGRRAYLLAREGKVVEMKPKTIEISKFVIEKIDLPYVDFLITCSKGTYIRSIARDLGEKLGVGGHLTKLRRTKTGNFHVENAFGITEFIEQL